jgi:hypothetical protein
MSKEKKQPTLFQDEQYEWEGMPEFEQKDLSPWHQVNVRFANEEDFEEFKHRMEQEITPKQKSLWFPFKPHRKASAFVYIDESDEDLSDEGQ